MTEVLWLEEHLIWGNSWTAEVFRGGVGGQQVFGVAVWWETLAPFAALFVGG